MRTLLASSGSTLGHGPTTRTHAFRRPPKREQGRPRHTHTHTIYAVRRVYSARAHPVASPPSPVSRRLASASLAVSEPTPPPRPTPPPLPPSQPAHKRRGAHSFPLRVERVHADATARGSHKAVRPHCRSPPPSPTPALPRQRSGGDRLLLLLVAIAAAAPHRRILILPSRAIPISLVESRSSSPARCQPCRRTT